MEKYYSLKEMLNMFTEINKYVEQKDITDVIKLKDINK